MVTEDTANEVISRLRQDPANNICQDCPSTDIKFVSVNHGIFICESCAIQHQTLGSIISFVKPLKDTWSIRQLKLLTAGGNATLKSFFSSYRINEDSKVRFKYHTIAAKYYREMIKVMAEGETCNMRTPSLSEGIELIIDPSLVDIKPVETAEESKNEGISDFVSTAIKFTLGFGKKAKEAAQIVGQEIVKGAQYGMEKLDFDTEKIKKNGVNYLRVGAAGAFDAVTDAAYWTYHRIGMDETTRRIKEDNMSFLNTIEIENKREN